MATPLPIDACLPELITVLQRQGCAVLQAPPGAGKTTRVPAALLDALPAGDVVVLEPRRIAARSAAEFVALERGSPLGDEVGYRVRFERRGSAATRLWFVTEGLLTRQLAQDPYLEGVAALVLDEFHERHVHGDLALAVALELRRTVRPELQLLVMSATLDAAPIAAHLDHCPVLTVAGRQFPVEVAYRDPQRAPLAVAVSAAVRDVLRQESSGDLLVFLPGVGEIRRVGDALADTARDLTVDVLPLHGNLPLDAQRRVLEPGPRRRVVLSTNVAETALTIPGVRAVIDSGLARIARYDARHGINSLALAPISRAAAEQRAGRAGRVAPGRCVRLWSEAEHGGRLAREIPEILRLDLAELVLQLSVWGGCDVDTLPWLDAPPAPALQRARRLLVALGAIDATGRLTDTGRRMASIAAEPRLARMLVEAERLGQPGAGALVAAIASERDLRPEHRGLGDGSAGPRWHGPGNARSDLLDRAELFEEARRRDFDSSFCQRIGIERRTAQAVDRTRVQFARALRLDPQARLELDEEVVLRAVLAGFPDRVVRRRAPNSPRGVMVGGIGVVLDSASVVTDAELFVAVEVEGGARRLHAEARVRLASAVQRQWLAQSTPGNWVEACEAVFDSERQAVLERRTTSYLGLELESVLRGGVAHALAAPLLAAAARADPARAVSLGAAEEAFLTRVAFARRTLGDAGFPSREELLGQAIDALAATRRSFVELRQGDLLAALRHALAGSLRASLAQEAPESYLLPSGRNAAIQYRDERPPIVQARVQELFGLIQTPRLARGRVPLVIEILSPGQRPVQITEDLASFWRTTYPEVRKQLRGRYPRHDWPEDPFQGVPTRRAKPRRSG